MKSPSQNTQPPKKAVVVAFKASPDLARRLDAVVKAADTDRSKFIRQAVRRALGYAS